MDLIKETYDILNYHLGTEQRGSKRLGDEHAELKIDLNRLVSHAIKLGKSMGGKEVMDAAHASAYLIIDATLETSEKLRKNMLKSKLTSRGAVVEEKK